MKISTSLLIHINILTVVKHFFMWFMPVVYSLTITLKGYLYMNYRSNPGAIVNPT